MKQNPHTPQGGTPADNLALISRAGPVIESAQGDGLEMKRRKAELGGE